MFLLTKTLDLRFFAICPVVFAPRTQTYATELKEYGIYVGMVLFTPNAV
jgi:hypothetical protein